MNSTRFDRMSRLFARRLDARAAMVQEATPEPQTGAARRASELLFVQTFQSGTIVPKEGAAARYTVTLGPGSGRTVYFADRPDRAVGDNPTPQFIEGLGFSEGNPPNAALVVETSPGESDVAVIELFDPLYDPETQGVTYDVAVLQNWQAALGMELQEAPTDLAALAPSFGTAHLFIDGAGHYDCPNGEIGCQVYQSQIVGTIRGSSFDNFCSHQLWVDEDHGDYSLCVPCTTPSDVLYGGQHGSGDLRNVWAYWGSVCNNTFQACNGNCRPIGWCGPDPFWGGICPHFS
jgi:hypothetical protein